MRRLRVPGYGLQMMGALVPSPVAAFARILRRLGVVTMSLVLHLTIASMASAAAGPPANCLGPQPPDAIPNQYIVVLQEAITNVSSANGYEIETTNNTVSRSFTVPQPTCLCGPLTPPCTVVGGWPTARVAVNPVTEEAWFSGQAGCSDSTEPVGVTFGQPYVVRFGGSPSPILGAFDVGEGPIAITSSGTIYVATGSVLQAVPGGVVASLPDLSWDMALTPDDTTLYIAALHPCCSGADGHVYMVDTVTNLVTPIVMPLGAQPRGVAVNSEGTYVFVSEFLGDAIYTIDTATDVVSTSPQGAPPRYFNGVAAAVVPLF